jgi:hypothetical protein
LLVEICDEITKLDLATLLEHGCSGLRFLKG